MKVLTFDIQKGVYNFSLEELNAATHTHPVVEIVMALSGDFSLEVEGIKHQNIKFAIIDANLKHSINSDLCTAELLMIESHNDQLQAFLNQKGIDPVDGIFVSQSKDEYIELTEDIKEFALNNDLKQSYDERVAQCIVMIEKGELAYDSMIETLTSAVCLSESRLSHLFKQHTGTSLKKYLVWHKLKKATNLFLNNEINLTQAAMKSGFYDQAHLTNAFKNVLGISPSKEYNSRIVQF